MYALSARTGASTGRQVIIDLLIKLAQMMLASACQIC